MATPSIDFLITSNTHHLHVMDLSTWGVIEGKPAVIEVTLPGFPDCKTFYFDQHKINVFNSHILEVTCASCKGADKEALSDGIYTVTVKGSPDKFYKTRYYLKTDLFQMEVDKLRIENKNTRNWKNFNDKLTELEYLLQGAHSHLRMDLITVAGQLWETAQEALEDLKGCKNCSKDVWMSTR